MNTLIEIIGWLGSVSIFAGLYGVAHKRRNAFFFSIVGELAWVVKSVYLHAWDLLSMTLAFAALAAYGYYAWGEEARDEARQAADRVKQAEAAQHARDMKDYINGERAAMGQKPIDDVLDDVKENPQNYRVAWLNEQGEEVRLNVNQTRCVKEHLAMLAAMGAEEKGNDAKDAVTLAQIAAVREGATY